ncbi:MAG: Isoprenyl transferase [Parcubacteria group bacterium GW2011_GWA2_47_16]|nr:MAG: Isoprenyl transferase [Parcubacteria group bacterium GW2011_GWA2_47_16]
MIMDGNRRWAKAKNLPTFEGHRRGYEKLKEVARWVKKAGIKYLVVYALSTENWNRAKDEVSYLLDLIRLVLTEEFESIKKDGGRIICIGERERFSTDIQELMDKAERETSAVQGVTLVLALSYGGRAEIVQAVNRAVLKGVPVDEKSFDNLLWTKNIPNPDLIIRTGGEMRLSGFLPWQSVYSELFFTKTFWPDFSEGEFKSILEEFSNRKRNFGK